MQKGTSEEALPSLELQPLSVTHPIVIQGGMGIGVSNWMLAKAVAKEGQLGVVSGTCIDSVMVRRLQDGDEGGHTRRALKAFPLQEIADRVLQEYFLPDGRPLGTPYKLLPLFKASEGIDRQLLAVVGGFVEVFLAKEGHQGVVGMNLLTKIQSPNLATIYGAMLAGLDYLLMGAGIPREIPAVLEAFIQHKQASLVLDVAGERSEEELLCTFDPTALFPTRPATLKKPYFLPIVSTHTLAQMLMKRAPLGITGFIVEGPTAGGHNAPPREGKCSPSGEPIYGPKDEADLQKLSALGVPFWIAGEKGSPEELERAKQVGAQGIQVGTLFAYSQESGITAEIKEQTLQKVLSQSATLTTDADASPTGFPFKVVGLEESISEEEVYTARERVCDLGYLRTYARLPDGKVVARCPGEPEREYLKKGGAIEETKGKKCLCNGLFSVIGLGQQRRNGYQEPPLLTSGNQLLAMGPFLLRYGTTYSAAEVLSYLLSPPAVTVPAW